ncbi:MAG TPA: STAS/SEC14 domain-containing protein [Anaerolineaceae bacterium]|nr:STAS/SEC14 domain-containing protein [Anaerolineaceae bacterium]HPN52470.1 STAS/SEC14 domain-containing protein [Anaerolineaceae bacterium]
MDRVRNITHKGKSIILVDLSDSQPNDTLEALPAAKPLISKAGPKSALVLTDVTNAVYNKDVAGAMKEFVSSNTPYIRASAIVGADGVRLVLLQTIIMITRREIKTFANREQALEWLINH